MVLTRPHMPIDAVFERHWFYEPGMEGLVRKIADASMVAQRTFADERVGCPFSLIPRHSSVPSDVGGAALTICTLSDHRFLLTDMNYTIPDGSP